MSLVAELFRSVEFIWLLWGASLIGLTLLLRRSLRGLGRCDWFRLLREENGGAYSLAYVMTFPIYMLLVCVVIQASLILVVKMGTIYAAYAAARSAVVWLPAEPRDASSRIRRAAVHAMTPFASSSAEHAKRAGVSGGGNSGSFATAYKRYTRGGPAPASYLAAKHAFATGATRVTWQPSNPTENDNVEVQLTYTMPLHIPGAARVLGAPSGLYRVTSKATLPSEAPKGADRQPSGHPMGIDYLSL